MVGSAGCDPELRLALGSTGGDDGRSNDRSNSSKFRRVESLLRSSAMYQQQKQMTIFYKGRVCVCDATEIQARAIISMAKGEMDDMMTKVYQQQQGMESALQKPQPRPPSPQAMQQILNPGQSMKRSLQRFLQKRKARINDVSPYSQKQKLLFPIKLQQA